MGGISKTINYRGNRMDLGGHRFFSKSDWVMQLVAIDLPVQAARMTVRDAAHLPGTGARVHRDRPGWPSATAASEKVMLVRSRLSRIFYRRRFFDYPLKLNRATLSNLGLPTQRGRRKLHPGPLAAPLSGGHLEDFLVNRFGDKLYRTFFKDYTEKVWGVPCAEISAEWGAQRIKGLSISKALGHALMRPFRAPRTRHRSIPRRA